MKHIHALKDHQKHASDYLLLKLKKSQCPTNGYSFIFGNWEFGQYGIENLDQIHEDLAEISLRRSTL